MTSSNPQRFTFPACQQTYPCCFQLQQRCLGTKGVPEAGSSQTTDSFIDHDQHHHLEGEEKAVLFTQHRCNTLWPNRSTEPVNHLVPHHLMQACMVHGTENISCSLQHCLHKAISPARPADEVPEGLPGQLLILSFPSISTQCKSLLLLLSWLSPSPKSCLPYQRALQRGGTYSPRYRSCLQSCCWGTRGTTPGTPRQEGTRGVRTWHRRTTTERWSCRESTEHRGSLFTAKDQKQLRCVGFH